MATLKKGILDGFRGKVGTVIGSTWKGKDVMRALPDTAGNKPSERQLAQQQRFGMIMGFLKLFMPLTRIGFRTNNREMTAQNAAVSYNLANAVEGTYPNQGIAYDKVMLSQGTLAAADALSAESTGRTSLTLSWHPGTGSSHDSPSDPVMAAVYDPENGESLNFIGCASRGDGEAQLTLPSDWSGRNVYVYAFLISLAGDTYSPETVSHTHCAGPVQIM